MTKLQRDLLAACWNKNTRADFEIIRQYAVKFRKYDSLVESDIEEVVEKLNTLRLKAS